MQDANVIRQTEMLKSYNVLKANDAKQFVLAMKLFADDNQQMSPTNFSQVAEYLGGKQNPVLERFKQFEIVYEGALNGITSSSNTIVVRGIDTYPSANGKWVKVYGFADGHSESVVMPKEGFEDWEKRHKAP